MNPSITYIILAHGEPQVASLVGYLSRFKEPQDKIWILNDPTTKEYEAGLKKLGVFVLNHKLEGDYAAHRNIAVDRVSTDYLYMIDADETPAEYLMQNLKALLQQNNPDAMWQPRKNVFSGVKPIHALLYGWQLQGEIVNWPDSQCRLVKNRKGIRWVGRLHERPKLTKTHNALSLPADERFALIHSKQISTQLADNDRYNKEFSVEDNQGTATQELLSKDD